MSNELSAADLMHFTGTEHYYRWSVLFPKCLMTDGAKYVAENAGGGAYWLMDVIASHLRKYGDTFGVAKLVRTKQGFTFTLDDGNGRIAATQHIEYSDFPMDKISFYVCWDTVNWTIMLPSEY